MKYTNRADLLIAAGNSIKMQEKAKIVPLCKSRASVSSEHTCIPISDAHFGESTWNFANYEFPLVVVEGKPVFVGDELYGPTACLFIVDNSKDEVNLYGHRCDLSSVCYAPSICSWLPPKPHTVMVELLREYAQAMADSQANEWAEFDRLTKAYSKALEAK